MQSATADEEGSTALGWQGADGIILEAGEVRCRLLHAAACCLSVRRGGVYVLQMGDPGTARSSKLGRLLGQVGTHCRRTMSTSTQLIVCYGPVSGEPWQPPPEQEEPLISLPLHYRIC